MDDETRRRCLEPFFTTKGERGTGLGLAMVYGIAQRHGMEIDIASAPRRGHDFPPDIPAAWPVAHPGGRQPGRRIRRRARASCSSTTTRCCSRRCAMCWCARVTRSKPRAAANKASTPFIVAQRAGTPFPVVITDLGMPHVDGRAVAAAIAAAAPGTPVLMLTGWGQRLADGEHCRRRDRRAQQTAAAHRAAPAHSPSARRLAEKD